MPAWSWWLILGGIAVVAVSILGGLGVGLWRRVKALLGDLERVSALAEQLSAALGAGAQSPAHPATPTPARHRS